MELEQPKTVLDNIFGFFISDKFYLPLLYIIIGIITYVVISRVISDISKVNISKIKGKKLNQTYVVAIDKRKVTIVNLVRNIIKYVIAIIVILAILSLYGVNTTSILASIGVVGAVIGLAFQDIIKDLLAGIFIIFDNAYAVGDYVEINGFMGEVIELGLKTTKIKAYTGEVKIVSNSAFKEVINYNLKHNNVLVDIPLSYNCDIDKIEEILTEIIPDIKLIPGVKHNIDLLGIDKFEDSSMIYRLAIECSPMQQFTVKRAVLKIVKKAFDKHHITIPYNQLDIHLEKN